MQYRPEKLWNKYFVLMMLINSFSYMGFIFINPILTKYTISLGASITFAGVITGAFALTALFFRPLTGSFTDHFEKKRLMIITLSTIALVTLGYGLTKNAYIILALRILHGMFFSFFSTASSAFGASFIPSNKLGQGVGYLGIGMILASAIGPSVSPYIAALFGYNTVFFISCIIISISVMLILLFKKTRQPKTKQQHFSIKANKLIAKELIIPMILGGIASLMSGLISGFILVFGDVRNITNISLIFIVTSVFILIARLTSGKVMDNKGLSFVIYPAFSLIGIAAIILGFAHSLWMVLIAAALYGFGQGSSQPSLQAYCIKKLGPARMGIAVSTFFLGLDIAQGIGPIVGGVIIEKFGFTVLFCIVAVILLAGMLLFKTNNRKKFTG